MRSTNTWALMVGVGATMASAMGADLGCNAKKPTEIVPGATTQVQVPGNLAVVKLHVLANGQTAFCGSYQVGPGGQVELPGSLGVVSGAAGTKLDITLTGYDQAALTAGSQDAATCNFAQLKVGDTASTTGPGPRVLRESVVEYVDQRTLFLPMPLSFSCYDVDCSSTSGQACKAGKCSDTTIAPGVLVDFDPSLVDGTQDCFPKACMSATVPAVPVDPASCTFEFPAALTPAGNGPGLNVSVAYAHNQLVKDTATGGNVVAPGEPLEQEILNRDVDEGFTIPDASKPTQFKLADGLCALWQAAQKTAKDVTGTNPFTVISDVQVTVACPVKEALTPFCAPDQQSNVTTQTTPPDIACGVDAPLTPTPGAIYLVVDHSVAMNHAFGSTGYAALIGETFSLPVFRKTYVAMQFLTHDDTECTSGTSKYPNPATAFGFAADVQPLLLPQLLQVPTETAGDTLANPASLDLLAALQGGTGVYAALSNLAAKHDPANGLKSLVEPTVMFFVNRTPVFAGASDGGAGEGGAGDAGSPQFGVTGNDCNPGASGSVQKAIEAKITAASSDVHTDFIVLDNNAHVSAVPFYDQIQSDLGSGASGGPVDVVDATGGAAQVIQNVAQAVFNGITCVYDAPKGLDNTAKLQFWAPPHTLIDAAASTPFGIPFNNQCTLANRDNAGIDGWNLTGGRVVVCGHSCQGIQASIGAATLQGVASQLGDGGAEGGASIGDGGVSAADVPVTATMPCANGQ
jgi:hypothetical protein